MPEGWKPEDCGVKCKFANDDFECEKHKEDCPIAHAVPVKEVDPLAVLAGTQGFSIRIGSNGKGVWFISLRRGHNTREQITAPTYSECEAKARAYLESLDDVKGGRPI